MKMSVQRFLQMLKDREMWEKAYEKRNGKEALATYKRKEKEEIWQRNGRPSS